MADIKFMDISENDNPATTDSILVGNQENGVKRTTLGKIGDMFAVHGLLHFETVSVKLTADNVNSSFSISAPEVEGYTFAFWLSSATKGTMFGTYIENPAQSNTAAWFTHEASANADFHWAVGNSINCIAVYVKNTVA